MIIDVQFLGKPQVLIDGIPIELEQNKIYALLLYVLYSGSSTRDELAELLWCDYSPECARRNLRNGLYKLKTLVGKNILEAKGHSIIRVAPEVILRKDVDLFITEGSGKQLMSLENYIFLEKFYIRNCTEFDNWVAGIRNVYEKLIVKRFTSELRGNAAKKDHYKSESCAVRILRIDPYHEEAARTLMQVCMSRGEYNKAASCYQRLKERLEEDLGIQPAEETSKLYQKLLELKKTVQAGKFDLGERQNRNVVDTLDKAYHDLKTGRPTKHCILCGDIGMGKSETLQLFLSKVSRDEVISVEFRRTNREVAYYGAERLMEMLSSWSGLKQSRETDTRWGSSSLYYFKQFENLFSHMDRQGRKGVLIMQNLESIDSASMDIFSACLFERKPTMLLVVGEYCPSFEKNPQFLQWVGTLPHFQLLQFPLLDERGCAAYLQEQLGKQFEEDDDVVLRGYELTGGNLLLLREYAQNISRNPSQAYALSMEGMQMVDELLASLNPQEYRQMEVLSVLRIAEVEILNRIMEMPSIAVMQVLDNLSKRGWISEREEDGHLLLCGRFGFLQNLIHERMPRYKRLELHRLAAEYYEQKFQQHPKDLFYLTELRSHYNQTCMPYKRIYYNVLYLERVLDYCDEFFPTIVDENIQLWAGGAISRQEAFQYLDQYSEELQKLEDELLPQQYEELRIKLEFLRGRALIRCGKRDQGLVVIKQLIEMAGRLSRNDILLKCYVEAFCCGLRSEDPVLMDHYLQLAYANEDFDKYEKEKGVFYRLHGYLCMFRGEYAQAEECLDKSIAVFEQPRLRGTNYVNIAAAWSYRSLNRRYQMRLEEALVYIRKAIDLCVEKKVQKSLDVFYEDCGYILFLMGNYAEAEQYFLQSIALYERFDTFWLRSIAESGLAMIYAYREDPARSLEHFRWAEVFSRKEQADEELAMLEQAREVLKEKNIL